jgi:iron complex transport system substrate-binding protein
MIVKRVRYVLCRMLFLCFLAASPGLANGADPIRLEQADGSTLPLDAAVQSLVTLSPHLTELVFAAGAGDLIMATVEFSEFPAAAADIPRIGDAFRLDIERIVSLHPELVIAWGSGNPTAATEQLRSMGIPVWSVEILGPDEIPRIIESIGQVTDRRQTAFETAQKFRKRLAELIDRYRNEETLEFFYQVDARPLFTINGEHPISKGLSLCGGRNIFEEEQGLAFQAAHESVILADPDALFAPWLEGDTDPLDGWRSWPGMQAVQNEALFLLNADEISRATPRLLDSLELACKLLHELRERNKNE